MNITKTILTTIGTVLATMAVIISLAIGVFFLFLL